MIDVLIKNDELNVIAGDFATGEDLLQRQYLLLQTDKGEWKQWPKTGVGIFGFLEEENPDGLFREIREQLMMDGIKLREISISPEGRLKIDAR